MSDIDTETMWINSVIFFLILLSEGFVFYKLKFKIDFSGKLTLLLHLLVSILRFLVHWIDDESIIWLFLFFECRVMVSFSLYYFVFEMKLI